MAAASPHPAVRVLGLGNVLMGDDALGPWVVQHLEANYRFPRSVGLTDLGTPGLDLAPYLMGIQAAIFVDTIKSDGPPGGMRLYRREQLVRARVSPRLSPHDPGVMETLQLLELAGDGPREVLLIGVIPERVGKGIGLTPTVRECVPVAGELVLLELMRLGVPPTRRLPPRPVSPWWENAPAPVHDEVCV